MKLHAIKHTLPGALWCGPSAVSAVTGLDTATIVAKMKAVTGRKFIKGLSEEYLCRTLEALGCTIKRSSINNIIKYDPLKCEYVKPTLAQWLRANKELYANNPVILTVGHHFVTVMGRQLVDNHTPNFEPVFLSKAPHRRKRVSSYVVIHSVPARADIVLPPAPPAPAHLRINTAC